MPCWMGNKLLTYLYVKIKVKSEEKLVYHLFDLVSR